MNSPVAPIKLRRYQYGPTHTSLVCCGREQVLKIRTLRLGVQRIEDQHHITQEGIENSGRQVNVELLDRNILEQRTECALCHEVFTDYHDVVPDRIDPKGIGVHGETIILTSKQLIGGATVKRGQPESTIDGPPGTFEPKCVHIGLPPPISIVSRQPCEK